MTIYGLFNMANTPKIDNTGKKLKFKNSKSTFHLFVFFEKRWPIGLL
jgi:hypothetical protein